MTVATPRSLGVLDAALVYVKGGHGHGHGHMGRATEGIITDGDEEGDIITAGGVIDTQQSFVGLGRS